MDVSEATVREVFTELDDQNILKIWRTNDIS